MDLFSMDKKFEDMEEQEFGDLLDQDLFTPSPSDDSCSMDFGLDNGLDTDTWLDTFFDDPVLNDRMISDALQPHPQVQSEHSYSLANMSNDKGLDLSMKKEEKDSDSEMLGTTVNPNSMTLTVKTEPSGITTTSPTSAASPNYMLSPSSSCSSSSFSSVGSSRSSFTPSTQQLTSVIKKEPVDQEKTMVTVTRTMNPQTLLKPTIILATQPAIQHTGGAGSHQSRAQERLVLPKVNVKVEPAYSVCSSVASSPEHISYDQISLPPTPPSSSTSDSEGCQSPECSLPSSPSRGSHISNYHSSSHHTVMARSHIRLASPSPPPSSTGPFFMSPIPTSGVLILSEEEKRTLISEGYPIPSKLPLTKGEEKNLKKIRRKIKNKISAQESRRKKKEYLESLERKVESYSQENVDLKKKVDSLESNNRSLMSQLQKLQSIVSKIRPQNSSQTGTCLMVLVLCFAVFLGTWSPMTWNIGYSSINATPGSLGGMMGPHHHGPLSSPPPPVNMRSSPAEGYNPALAGGSCGKKEMACDRIGSSSSGGDKVGPMGPPVKEASSDPYATPNMKSRVLLSIKDEEEQQSNAAHYKPLPSFCLKDYITKWFSTAQIFSEPESEDRAENGLVIEPPIPKVEVLDVEFEINQTGGVGAHGGKDQASMHPDIAVVAQTTQMDTKA